MPVRKAQPRSRQRSHRPAPTVVVAVWVIPFAITVVLAFGGCPAERSSPPEPPAQPASITEPAPPPPPPPPVTCPQWGGDLSRNMVSDETGLPATFTIGEKDDSGGWKTPPVNVKWTARLGSQTCGTPTVAEGRVLVGTNNGAPRNPRLRGDRLVLMCFDADDGEFLWQLASPSPVYHGDFSSCGELGVCTSAAIDGNRAYHVTSRAHVVCTTLDPLGEALQPICTDQARYLAQQRERFSVGPEGIKVKRNPDPPVQLSPTDGNIVWLYDIMTGVGTWMQDAMSSSPLLIDDYLYVGTGNAEAADEATKPWPEGPSLIVLDKNTGELIARDRADIVRHVHHGQWSSPSSGVVNGRRLIFYGGGDGVCHAFDAQPKPGADGEPGTLETVWRCDANPPDLRQVPYLRSNGPSEIIATPVFHDDRVYVAIGQDPGHGLGAGCLTCIDATGSGDISETGVIWRYRDINRSVSTVSVADGLVYVADVEGTLHCVDAETGESIWTHYLGSDVWGSTLCADGKVYVGTQAGQLWVMKAGREKQILDTISLGSPMYATPVAACNTLYLATNRYLYAVSAAVASDDSVV